MTFTNIACDILPRRAPYAAKSIRLNIFASLPPSLSFSLDPREQTRYVALRQLGRRWIYRLRRTMNELVQASTRTETEALFPWMDRAVRFVPTDRLLRGLGRWNNLKSYVASSMNRFEPRKNGESVLDLVSSFFSFPSPLPQHRGERGCRSKTSFASAFR